MPKISVIMGIYNCEKYINESIDSILNQTLSDWELIMCDDGSKDQTYTIAKYYADKYPEKIKIIKNSKNRGLNYTLNKCLKRASGEYIARQDADDRSKSDRLRIEYEFLESNPEYALVSANMELFDEKGKWGKTNFSGEVTKHDLAKGSPFMHPVVMMRRKELISIGGYSISERLLMVEDYHLWFKFYIHGYKGFNLSDALYEYRDNREAFAKRTVKQRYHTFRLMLWGLRKLKIKKIWYIYSVKQLCLLLTPSELYAYLHKLKWSLNNK